MTTSSNRNTFQNSLYVGTNLQNILYILFHEITRAYRFACAGIQLFLYVKTIYVILLNRGGRRAPGKHDIFYALFSTIIVFSITVWVASQAWFGQEMWLLYPDFPGGPDAYWKKHVSDWYMDLGTTGAIVVQLMTDGLMIYRCRIVWNCYRVVVVPIVFWLGTLVLGIFVDWTSSAPGGNILTGLACRLGLAYWTVSIFLNTILTCMICYRIVRHGKRVQEHLGPEYASFYFSVITVVIESVFPYTISGIVFLVSYGMKSPTSIAFLSVYILMMCISPQLLILRVIMGRAWHSDTFKLQSSTIHFGAGDTSGPGSPGSDSNGARVHLQVLSNGHLLDSLDDKV